MSSITFSCGKRGGHQRPMITWARRRLADHAGSQIRDRASGAQWDQHGVIIADGVGMGKTWEALGSAALILYKNHQWRADGAKRSTNRRQMGHVLVVVPPGLVTKWSEELRRSEDDDESFLHYLRRWTGRTKGSPYVRGSMVGRHQRRAFVEDTLRQVWEVRRFTDLPSTYRRGGKLVLPCGIYIVNANVLLSPRGGLGLATLRKADWDVVIADEAHHNRSRAAVGDGVLHAVAEGRSPLLLLSATPFQLGLGDLAPMAEALATPTSANMHHTVLRSQPIRDYFGTVQGAMEGKQDAASDRRRMKRVSREASRFLHQFLARNEGIRGFANRHYFLIDGSGHTHRGMWSANPASLADWLDAGAICAPDTWSAWYLRQRIRLGMDRRATDLSAPTKPGLRHTFLATAVRQLLSTPRQARRVCPLDPPLVSPRLDALEAWARRAAPTCLREALGNGQPRKTLVFTSYVNPAANEIRARLEEVWHRAVVEVARDHPHWRHQAQEAIKQLRDHVERLLPRLDQRHIRPIRATLGRAWREMDRLVSQPHPTATTLLLSTKPYARLLRTDLVRLIRAAATSPAAVDANDEAEERLVIQEQTQLQRKRARTDLISLLSAMGCPTGVMTYVGGDGPAHRSHAAASFRSVVGPWFLVASRVGAEGIDLHTWARHLVHFDLEWNPATMEQREGRCDRIGRRLKDTLDIHLLIVRHTYDERMLHQLAVRQRWHRLILGSHRKALAQVGEVPAAMAQDVDRLAALDLHLKPSRA